MGFVGPQRGNRSMALGPTFVLGVCRGVANVSVGEGNLIVGV